jgi:ubiquinone biosynthesis protein
MGWRDGSEQRRAAARASVPALIQRHRVPPGRAVVVALRLAKATAPWLLRHRRNRNSPAAQTELAGILRPTFESLGTTFIKLGQLIASADGMLPQVWVDEFKLCRDRVPAETFAHVREVIEQDLGRPLEQLFAEFDQVPLAAASIAQVHAARLHSGDEVVVKVMRPHIDRIVPRDIATLAWLAPIIERRAPNASVANLPAYVELFAETIVEELDFRLEAENMLDVARVLAATDQRSVIVPRPHQELVSRRVLVMERLHGFSVDDEAGMADAGVDPSPVFRALFISFLEGAMIHGVFHGDLHGGNMIVTGSGTPGLLDFGITGRFDVGKRQALLALMMSAASQDASAMLTAFRDLGGFPPDADIESINAELGIQALMTLSPAEVSPEDIALQMRETMNRLVAHGAKLPKEMYLYLKGMVYLNGSISTLAADVDMFSEMVHVYEFFTTQHSDAMLDSGIDMETMPEPEAIADLMRQQHGVSAETFTLREMQVAQAQRAEELRGAIKASAGEG